MSKEFDKYAAELARLPAHRSANVKFSLLWYLERLEEHNRSTKRKLVLTRGCGVGILIIAIAAAISGKYQDLLFVTLTAAVLAAMFVALNAFVSWRVKVSERDRLEEQSDKSLFQEKITYIDKLLFTPQHDAWWISAVILAGIAVLAASILAAVTQTYTTLFLLQLAAVTAIAVVALRASIVWGCDIRGCRDAKEKLYAEHIQYTSILEDERNALDREQDREKLYTASTTLQINFKSIIDGLGSQRLDRICTESQGRDFFHKIRARLRERRQLLVDAKEVEEKLLSPGAACVLQRREGNSEETEKGNCECTPDNVLEAVDYRLGITDLFVEKAQYHLEDRAGRYKSLGYSMYGVAVLLFAFGAAIAVTNMFQFCPQLQVTSKASDWINLLEHFLRAFSAYGFIVLTAVVLARGARACLDQRERLLAKRHSLRQGRLYLHLTGGRVTIDDLERAFDWNRDQHNAFTHMTTDAKAPFGAALDELIKIIPELVKTGVAVAEKKGGGERPSTS
jgi:hypothetical protein